MQPKEYELKRNNRFIVEFPDEFGIESWLVEKITKPKYNQGTWMDIKIDFIDPIEINTSKLLFKLIENKNFEIKLSSLDMNGNVLEKWLISVPDIHYIDFGDCDLNNKDLTIPYVIITPSSCKLI